MTNLRITQARYWNDEAGQKVKQIETLLCEVVSENAHLIEFKVVKVEAVEGAASFYQPTTGGAIMKRFLNGYEGKVGMMTVSAAH
jgi:hypothetical protein